MRTIPDTIDLIKKKLIGLLDCYYSIIESIGNFIRTSKGYRVTAPEGYVAVDKVAGAVKLVDRLEFSRQNFTMPKGWN